MLLGAAVRDRRARRPCCRRSIASATSAIRGTAATPSMTLGKRGQNGAGGNRDDLTAFDLTASPPAPFVLKANIDTADPLKLPGDPMITATGNGVVSLIVSADGTSRLPAGRRLQAVVRATAVRRQGGRYAPAPRRGCSKARPTRMTTRSCALDADMSRLIVSRESKTHGAGQLSVDREHEAVGEPDEEQGSLSGDHRRQARRLRVHAPGRREGARPHLAADELSGGHARAGGVLGLSARVRGRARRTGAARSARATSTPTRRSASCAGPISG